MIYIINIYISTYTFYRYLKRDLHEKTIIYTVFTSNGLQGENLIYTRYHPEQKILSNDDILNKIKEKCPDVEFIGDTVPQKKEYFTGTIKGMKNELDDILFFGSIPDELISLDIPIIAVHPLWGRWQHSFYYYKDKKVLSHCIPVIPDKSEEVFNSRFEKIASDIKIIQAISKMKGLRILVITDKPILGEYEPTYEQYKEEGWEEYQEKYLKNLSELGASLIVRPQSEMVDLMEKADDLEAKKIAEKWISGAAGIKGTNEEEIRKSAKLYLAMKKMMHIYHADAITTEGYTVFQYYKDGPIPSQGMPSSQFLTDGIVATSETLLDSLITQQFGLWLTGSPGFSGDFIIDPDNNKVYIGHCESPINPYGDEKRSPYYIRNLPLWEENKGGAAIQVNLPVNEIVTVVKFSVHDKKISLFTGRSIDGNTLYPYFDDILCRTKVAIDTNAQKIFEKVDWKTFGIHRVVFFGDHREKFKKLGKMLGYEVIEKDQ